MEKIMMVVMAMVIKCSGTFRIDSHTIKRGETHIEMRLSKCH